MKWSALSAQLVALLARVGAMADAAASGTVGAATTMMSYAKQLVNFSLSAEQCIEKSDGTVENAATDDLFVITGGPILVTNITGIVTVAIGGAANGTLQITTTTPAATVSLSTTVALASAAAGTSIRFVGATGVLTPLAAGTKIIDPVTVQDCHFLCPIGTLKFLGSAAQTGNIKWYLTYKPLSPSSRVAAAA
jgi:hypothetical protein